MSREAHREAIDEILERIRFHPKADPNVTWEIHDEGTEDVASSLEIIASNGYGVVVTLAISEER